MFTPTKNKHPPNSISRNQTQEILTGLMENKENICYNESINVSQFSSYDRKREPLRDITGEFRSENKDCKKDQ